MAKKQPIVAHLADKAARGKPATAAKKPVSTAKASPAKPARTVAPAPIAPPQADLGGQQHLFVNLQLGALFTWDPDSGMPPMFYVKWSDHFFRELNTLTPRAINPTLAAIRCYHLPEKEVVARLKGMGT